jgi:hypothetical protein
MAKIEHYREIVKQIIRQHASHQLTYGDVKAQTIFDTEHDSYQLVHAGWLKKQRQYGCLIHIDIREEKLWIQYDGTEVGVANELVALGVPNEDIVLAYFSPFTRQYTDFAVA